MTPGKLTQLALTRDDRRNVVLYVDGVQVAQSTDPAALAWQSYPIALNDENGASRSWEGEFHRVIIYCLSLGADDIARDHKAGP